MKLIFFKLFFQILLFFDKLSSRKLIYKIISNFQETSYIERKILSTNLKFFVPNEISNWRVKTFFDKEPETLEWIDSFHKDKKIIFWDIGANIGLYSIYAAIRHKNIEIVSFEPSTNNLRILSRNISINNLENIVKINQFALSDKANCHELMNESEFIEGYSMSTFSYNQDFEGNLLQAKNKYRLFGTSISNLIEQGILNVPNYIKIDVDGIEHKILSGAKQVLNNRNLKGMLIEINENYEEQYRSVIDVMEKFNFKIKYKKQSQFELPEKFKNTFNYIFERDEI
tara:strand:- start:887 stop:1741 length:855 start_codon:yes stop_codon:yes gene_type:complete